MQRLQPEFHVKSAQAALEKCWELVREGHADLFRGQTKDWPTLVPSLFRTVAAAGVVAAEELELFESWSNSVPQMAVYQGDETAVRAIAQHYGIPSNF